MAVELLVLRLVHILGGLFWVGSGLFSAIYLAPALQSAGPAAAGAVMASMQKRRMFQVMPAVALLTILSGLRLMWIVSAGDPHWFRHRAGHTFAVSGGFAILAFLIGVFVSRPAMVRAGKMAQALAAGGVPGAAGATGATGATTENPAEELRRLQKRAALWSMVAMVLLVLATAGMAVARYV